MHRLSRPAAASAKLTRMRLIRFVRTLHPLLARGLGDPDRIEAERLVPIRLQSVEVAQEFDEHVDFGRHEVTAWIDGIDRIAGHAAVFRKDELQLTLLAAQVRHPRSTTG